MVCYRVNEACIVFGLHSCNRLDAAPQYSQQIQFMWIGKISTNDLQTRLNLMGRAFGLPKGLTMNDYIAEFSRRAMVINGANYIYANSVYSFEEKKISIECPKHGVFHQSPATHLKGAGCKRCADIERGRAQSLKSKEKFVSKATDVHNSKYDYSRTEYIKSSIKVEIICPDHGVFLQRPNSHLRGVGCPRCGDEAAAVKQRKTLEQFLSEANKIHGSSYDYSRVNYSSYHEKITIICAQHGAFEQTPAGHLAGRGCKTCGHIKTGDAFRSDNAGFIKKAQQIHGEGYDYASVVYVNNLTHVEIICADHGKFKQQPSKHIDAKQGCPSCANRDMDTVKFVQRANEIHQNKYDYTETIYLKAQEKVTILCPEHGCFEQKADHHLRGSGCEYCVDFLNSNGSKKIETWLSDNKFAFEREKRFDNLINPETGRSLRFDFYLAEQNTLIEFDGRQHFNSVDYFGGRDAYERVKFRDVIKNNWALENGIDLIRIDYKQEEEIDNILGTKLL